MRAWILALFVVVLAGVLVFALRVNSAKHAEPVHIEALPSLESAKDATAPAQLEASSAQEHPSRDERSEPVALSAREVALAAPNEAPIEEQLEIVGRALNEARQPLVRTTLWFRVESQPVSLEESDVDVGIDPKDSSVRTDGDGRFRIATQKLVKSNFATWFVLRARLNVSAEVPSPQSRTVLIPLASHTPRIDLADVVLELDPILAAGRVLLEDGSPAVNVRVRVEIGKGRGWRSERWLLALSDSSGSFSIRGRARSNDNLLVRGFRPSDLWIEPYSGPSREDLVLTAQSGQPATIRGRVQLDAGIDASELFVRFTSAFSPTSSSETAVDARSSSFVLNGLDVGPADFSIHLKRSRAEIAVERGIWARRGESKIDPELDPIDLRGTIHSIRAAVVDVNGTPAANARVNLYDDHTGLEAFEATTDANGKLDILVPRAITVLRLEKEGAKNVDIFDGASVTLQPE